MTMKRMLSVAVATSVFLGGALPAFAEEVVEADEPTNYSYYTDDAILLYSVDGDCTLTDDMTVTFEVADDGTISFEVGDAEGEDEEAATSGFGTFAADDDVDAEEAAPLDGCEAISVEGPNGQVNHGTVVSSVVKALKEMDLDIPLGQALKQIAKSDLGKGDQQVKVDKDEDSEEAELDDDSDDDSEEKAEKGPKSDRADNPNKGKGKNK